MFLTEARWTKIEEPCIPRTYVEHFIARIAEVTEDARFPNRVIFLGHKGLPYQSETMKISYKIFDVRDLRVALEEQTRAELNESAAFRHHQRVSESNTLNLTMREKIQRAKEARVAEFVQRLPQVPTSRINVVVSPGEGRATREMEIMYWPYLYKMSKCCKFQLRFFIQKCEL